MTTKFDKPFTFDRVVRLLISLIIIVTGIYFVYILRGVLLPFLIAWLIAYLLNPLVRFLQEKARIRNRVAAVATTLLLVVGAFTLLVIALIPTMQKEVSQINDLVATYQFTNLNIQGLPTNVQEFVQRNVDFVSLQKALSKENAAETAQYLVPALKGIVSSTISILFGIAVLFIMILYLIFILIDYDKMNKLWRELIPIRHRPQVMRITRDVEKNMNTYFRHQALICLIVGVLYAIGFQIIGLPMAIMMGALIAVLHMVPYLQVISGIPAVLLCWLKASQTNDSFWTMIGLTLLIYVIIQCILDGFLVPRIMGRAMGLNPAIILLSLSVWGALLGIVGMIIAIPLTTLILSYYQSFIDSEAENNSEVVEESNNVGIGD